MVLLSWDDSLMRVPKDLPVGQGVEVEGSDMKIKKNNKTNKQKLAYRVFCEI